ncbi:hypothetical protein BST36_20795 [Mycolicibacterium moriokaense]|uniref:hypothetical protein n=1 Tax=Mycolicibacterium moriokaense TaxID=39691 RepID=UPI0009F4A8F3|nr:hypothetical protein [Mycolicibacterium moriokaense]MCV7039690.1 hypothetical protein [Mycolicibacterium moriokaense]ORB19865.1 hypothetical protein BST36_20795 [Mycolicibacterium moriokaense]
MRRDLDRATTDVNRWAQNAGQDAGRSFGDQFGRGIQRSAPRVQAALIGVQGAAEKLRIEQDKLADAMRGNDFDKVAEASNRVTRAYEQHDRATRKLHAAYDGLGRDSNTASRAASSLTTSVSEMGGAFTRAASPLAIGALVAGIGQLVGVAAAASGAIGVLPAVLGSAGAAFGTLKLATVGFSDALENLNDPEKFAEALRQMSPQAQQAALSIKGLLSAFTGLKNATQDALFAGVGPQLTKTVNALLPTIQQATTGIASSFNEMFEAATNQLMQPDTASALNSIVANMTRAFEQLAPAAAPFTKAITDIVSVGSQFLPQMAQGATEAAKAFSQFITEASQSGQLKEWMATGLDILKQMGPLALDAAKSFLAMAEIGERVMPLIADTMHVVAEILPPIATGTAALSPLFKTWEVSVKAVGTAVDLLGTGFTAVAGIVETVANSVISVVNRMGTAISGALDPIRSLASIAGINIPVFTGVDPLNLSGGQSVTLGGIAGGSAAINRTSRAPAAVTPVPMPGLPNGIGSAFNPTQSWSSPRLPGNTMSSFSGGGGGGGGSAADDLPVLPYDARDPMSLLQGYPVTSSLYNAAGSLLDASHRRAQEEADLNALLADNLATANQIQDARNDLARAEREEHEAELRLQEAKAAATEKATNQIADLTGGLEALGAGLDADLGLSKGLAGLADNLVRFLGAIATAPLQAQLQRQIAANPNEGSGIVGILAAQGAFGPRWTPQAIAATQAQGGFTGATPQGTYASAANPNAIAMMNLAMQSDGGRYAPASDLVNGLADCSGAVSDLVEMLTTGTTTAGRLFTTHNAGQVLQSMGATPGYVPGNLNIGINPAHMAATLPNGVNFESGGSGGGPRYGGSAAGALDPQFVEHWSLPTGYGGASTWPSGPGALPNIVGGAGESPILGASGPGIGGAAGYQPTVQPQAPQGWSPGSKSGGGGGLAGMAATAAASAFPGAGAAAQIASQLISRTIAFGGEQVGNLVAGAQDFWSVSDPDGGPGASIGDSWLGRLAGSIASATPQLPSTAGGADKATEQGKQQQAAQQGMDAVHARQGRPAGVYIDQFIQSPDRQGVQHTANDLLAATYQAGMR